MKTLIVTTALLLVTPMFAWAQNPDHPYYAEGFGFVAYEATQGPAGGVGGEFIDEGFGMGGEFLKAESPFGEHMLSANMSYHFVPSKKNRQFEPFVTGGLTRFSVPNLGLYPVSGWNIGGGANLWLRKHAALRLEVRDAIGGQFLSTVFEPGGNYFTAPQNLVTFRIGITFR